MKIFKKLFDSVGSGAPVKEKVLLVESDDQDAAVCFNTLVQANFEVHRVANCAESFQLLKSGTAYKAIVTNFYLSDGTAVELLRYAKVRSPDTIAIVLAREVDENLLLEAINAGASYCIPQAEGQGNHLAQLIKLGHEQNVGLKKMASSS